MGCSIHQRADSLPRIHSVANLRPSAVRFGFVDKQRSNFETHSNRPTRSIPNDNDSVLVDSTNQRPQVLFEQIEFLFFVTFCISISRNSIRCWVSGWGAQNFVSGATQAIQTQVDVPIVDQATCQTKLRTTKLGSGFVLDNNSFMCAGGEPGKGS